MAARRNKKPGADGQAGKRTVASKRRKEGHIGSAEKVLTVMELLTANPAQRPYRLVSEIMRRFEMGRRGAQDVLSRAREVLASRESPAALKALEAGFVFVLGDALQAARARGDDRAVARILGEVQKFIWASAKNRPLDQEREFVGIEFNVVPGRKLRPPLEGSVGTTGQNESDREDVGGAAGQPGPGRWGGACRKD